VRHPLNLIGSKHSALECKREQAPLILGKAKSAKSS
jgi:hypothetical protein